jgi:hypothetical protein
MTKRTRSLSEPMDSGTYDMRTFSLYLVRSQVILSSESEKRTMARYPVYEGKETCQRCHKAVEKHKAVWLELNMRTGLYQKPGTVKPKDSQGGFAFGPDCAKVVALAKGECHHTGLAVRNGE